MKRKAAVILPFVIALVLVLPLVALASVDWFDDFDSYPTGQDLHGVGGWKGWGNDPTFTAFTTAAQAASAPNSVDIVGNSDLVHEYSGYTSGTWTFGACQYLPSDLEGQTYFILLNQYDDAGATNNWSTQVLFDVLAGTVVDTGASGATAPVVTNQWVPIDIQIDLTQDTQAFYYNGVLFYTGTWSGHVSGGGIPAIGALDLFANGASSAYYDNLSLTAGFNTTDCEPPAEVSIELDKTVGTTAGVCATTDEIVVPAGYGGTDVYYCYEVTNTSDITLTHHDLDDSELGTILSGFEFDLGPGASVDTVAAGLELSATITSNTTNVATWTAYISGTEVMAYAMDAATVTVAPPTGVALSDFGAEMSTSLAPLWLAALLAVIVVFGLVIRRKIVMSD